jgi:hypothetical protein
MFNINVIKLLKTNSYLKNNAVQKRKYQKLEKKKKQEKGGGGGREREREREGEKEREMDRQTLFKHK